MTDTPPARSITKSVSIDRPAPGVHSYLADARNWPRWSIVNVLAIEAGADPGWWRMTTPRHQAAPHPRGRADRPA